MKKLITAFFVLTIVMSLAACGTSGIGAAVAGNTANIDAAAPVSTTVSTTESDTASVRDTAVYETAPEETEAAQPEPSEDPQPTETVPAETQPAPTEPEETHPPEQEPLESEPAETKPAESKPTESKPTESKPTESKPTESKPADSEHTHDYTYKRVINYTYCTDRGTEYHVCQCGKQLNLYHMPSSHTYQNRTITKATHDKEGLKEVTCIWCPYTATEVIPKVDVPYFKSFEIISVNRPNAHYLTNGQDLLTRLYGPNQAFQLGDSIVVRVNMSDGGSNFKLRYSHDCIVTQEGNLLYISFETEFLAFRRQSSFHIQVSDRDGELQDECMIFELCCNRNNLGDGYNSWTELRKYGERLGMKWITNGTDFVDYYNGGYTAEDESLSLTGCTIRGTDDLIYIYNNPDWIDEAIWLLDKYAEMGFTIFTFGGYNFGTLAE